jgi:hypothetical protein
MDDIQTLFLMFIVIILFMLVSFSVWWIYPFNVIENVNRYELYHKYKVVKRMVNMKDCKRIIDQSKPLLKRYQVRYAKNNFSSEIASIVDTITTALETPYSSVEYVDVNKIVDDNWHWDIEENSVGVYVMLNNDFEGGHIKFGDSDIVKLNVGDALFFRNNCPEHHCHCDVKEGEKWIMRIIVK